MQPLTVSLCDPQLQALPEGAVCILATVPRDLRNSCRHHFVCVYKNGFDL